MVRSVHLWVDHGAVHGQPLPPLAMCTEQHRVERWDARCKHARSILMWSHSCSSNHMSTTEFTSKQQFVFCCVDIMAKVWGSIRVQGKRGETYSVHSLCSWFIGFNQILLVGLCYWTAIWNVNSQNTRYLILGVRYWMVTTNNASIYSSGFWGTLKNSDRWLFISL